MRDSVEKGIPRRIRGRRSSEANAVKQGQEAPLKSQRRRKRAERPLHFLAWVAGARGSDTPAFRAVRTNERRRNATAAKQALPCVYIKCGAAPEASRALFPRRGAAPRAGGQAVQEVRGKNSTDECRRSSARPSGDYLLARACLLLASSGAAPTFLTRPPPPQTSTAALRRRSSPARHQLRLENPQEPSFLQRRR